MRLIGGCDADVMRMIFLCGDNGREAVYFLDLNMIYPGASQLLHVRFTTETSLPWQTLASTMSLMLSMSSMSGGSNVLDHRYDQLGITKRQMDIVTKGQPLYFAKYIFFQ